MMKKGFSILLCAVLLASILGGVFAVNAASDTVNGFRAFATGGLVGGTDYDPNITLSDYSGTDRVLVTGRGGTNYGDPNNPRSTMGVYSVKALRVDKLEILYSVEQWIGSGDHWYAFALTNQEGEWFENDGSDNALFFMFQYVNGNVILKPHHIGNGAGWTPLGGDTVGVPAAAGQYSIRIDKTDAGYVVSMKNAQQEDYTPQVTVDTQIVEGLFPDGKAYLMAGAYVATYADPWAFVLGAHEAEAEQPTPPPATEAPQPTDPPATTPPATESSQPTTPPATESSQPTAPSATEGAQPTDPTGATPPKTGDGGAPMLALALALLTVSGAAAAAICRRKSA